MQFLWFLFSYGSVDVRTDILYLHIKLYKHTPGTKALVIYIMRVVKSTSDMFFKINLLTIAHHI